MKRGHLKTSLMAAFLCLQGSSLTSQVAIRVDSVFSASVLRADLDYLREKIFEIHPDPYIYCTTAEFDQAFKTAEVIIADGLSYRDFASVVASTLRVMKDSHSLLQYSALLQPYRIMGGQFVDFDVISHGDTLFVTEDREGLLQPGTVLLSMNGHNAWSVRQSVRTFSIQEGHSEVSLERVTDLLFPAFSGLYTDFTKGLTLVVQPHDRQTPDTLNYPVRTSKDLKKIRRMRNPGQPVYGLDFHDENEIAVLRIGSFDYRSSRHYHRFLRRSFKAIDRRGVQHLAIDVRDNTGGRSNRVESLLAYLNQDYEVAVPRVLISRQSEASHYRFKRDFGKWSRFMIRTFTRRDSEYRNYLHLAELPTGSQDTVYFHLPHGVVRKHFYDGEAALFMNGISGSASANFAAVFKWIERGYLYGEPCLGPMNGTWGNPVPVRLKNTKLPLYISTIRFNLNSAFEYDPAPVRPHIEVAVTRKSLISGNDPWLEALRRHVYSQGR